MTSEAAKILIVDDREGRDHPDFSSYSDIVEFRHSFDVSAAANDPESFRHRYVSVFIHGNYQRDLLALDFLDNIYNRFYYRFRGERGFAHEDNYLEMHFDRYAQHVIEFIEHYRRTGELRNEIFEGRPLKREVGVRINPIRDEHGRRTIRFTSDQDQSGDGTLFVYIDSYGRLDLGKTLQQIAEESEPAVIYLTEQYDGRPPFTGIQLLLHLRLGTFLGPVSRSAVILRLETALDDLVSYSPAFSVVLTTGVTRIAKEDPNPVDPPTLSIEKQKVLVEELGVPEPDIFGPHDVSNLWGSLSFRIGLESLRNAEPPSADLWMKEASSLLREPFYWKLLGSMWLRVRNKEVHSFDDAVAEWDEWVRFIRQGVHPTSESGQRMPSRPIRILFIDDELESGWRAAYKVLTEIPDAECEVGFYPEEGLFVHSVAKQLILDNLWDLVVCDLRLLPAEERGWSSPDTSYLDNLSGVKLLQEIKRERPTMPVVVATASSRTWTYRHLDRIGADGYWTKEHPLHITGLGESVRHSSTLLKEMRTSVERRQTTEFLWRLRSRMLTAADDKSFLNRFARGAHPFDEFHVDNVSEYYTEAAHKLGDAYAYLVELPGELTSFRIIAPNEIAFLTIWSCVNEATDLFLYVEGNSGSEQGYYLGIEGAPVEFLRNGRVAPGFAYSGLNPKLLRERPGRRPHTECLKLLFAEYQGSGSMMTDFHACRKLRNELRAIHGVQNNRVDISDLRKMAVLLFYMFRLDKLS